MDDLPRVTIVTPSFNQAAFLEQTIQSVLQQPYPNIEYMVLDGGSTDGSAEILRKYGSRLAYWHSQKDRGQWDAINQGLRKATGQIVAYLNSDDCLAEHAVEKIVRSFQEHPDIALVYGRSLTIDTDGRRTGERNSWDWDLNSVLTEWKNPIPQPSAFLRKDLFSTYGLFDERWTFIADFAFWLRIGFHERFLYLPEVLSFTRYHGETKTATIGNVLARELIQLCSETVKTTEFRDTGIDPQLSTRAVFHLASHFYREGGHRMDALKTYASYCRMAFSPPVALYRSCRYLAGLIFKTW
ncbi:MAG TPA: glycosyltransferase family 2 protein [Acidobacteriota bacterium]|nr:glycosyltransferase family 2 protein [Acidobacteriota bacterium]